MNDNGAFRKKKVYFTQVSNNILRDNTLSSKAKGLYALIQSYITIENFTLYKNALRKDCKEGEKGFESMWKELKDRGLLVQYKLRNEKGGFYYEYDLLDMNQPPKKEGVDHTSQKEGVDNGGVQKGGAGKGGVYNNTNLNNTNLNNTKEKKKTSLPSDPVDKFFNSIKTEMDTIPFNNFIKKLSIRIEGNVIVVTAPDIVTKTVVLHKFLKLIEIHLRKYFEYEYITIESLEK